MRHCYLPVTLPQDEGNEEVQSEDLGWTLDSRRLARQGGPERRGWAALLESSALCCYNCLPAFANPCSHPWVLTFDASPDLLTMIRAPETSNERLSLDSFPDLRPLHRPQSPIMLLLRT